MGAQVPATSRCSVARFGGGPPVGHRVRPHQVGLREVFLMFPVQFVIDLYSEVLFTQVEFGSLAFLGMLLINFLNLHSPS